VCALLYTARVQTLSCFFYAIVSQSMHGGLNVLRNAEIKYVASVLFFISSARVPNKSSTLARFLKM
jgi:hypothetical protein